MGSGRSSLSIDADDPGRAAFTSWARIMIRFGALAGGERGGDVVELQRPDDVDRRHLDTLADG